MTPYNAPQGWSALVYSRTYEVDFRLLVAPDSFNSEDEAWAMQYVLGTTRHAAQLQQQPRWSVFKDDRYCVVGVTCIVKELLEAVPESTRELNITEDSQSRLTYAFFGYVAQQLDQLIEAPAMDLAVFYPLCQYIADRWFEKSHQAKAFDVVRSQPTQIATQPYDLFPPVNLNCASQEIQFWSSDRAEELWFAAAQDPFPSSICIGWSDDKRAIETPFLNATLPQVEKSYRVRRVEPLPPSTPVVEQSQDCSWEDDSQDWIEWDTPTEPDRKPSNKFAALQADPVKFFVKEVQEVLEFVLKLDSDSAQSKFSQNVQSSDSIYGFAPKDPASDSNQKWFGN